MLCDVKGATYEERVENAGLTTLKERRKRGDLIETFKTLKGFNKVEISGWFELQHGEENRPTRRKCGKKSGHHGERKSGIGIEKQFLHNTCREGMEYFAGGSEKPKNSKWL